MLNVQHSSFVRITRIHKRDVLGHYVCICMFNATIYVCLVYHDQFNIAMMKLSTQFFKLKVCHLSIYTSTGLAYHVLCVSRSLWLVIQVHRMDCNF